MSVEALGVFLIAMDGRTGNVQLRLHNVVGQRLDDGTLRPTIATNVSGDGNHIYTYVPFIYQGGTRNRTGDNITAGIGMAPNEISMAYAVEMTETVSPEDSERLPMTVRVITTALDPRTAEPLSPVKNLTDELWIAAGMSYTSETLEIVLSSAIDAVNALAPNYSLNRMNVGQLPVTGRLSV
jgi:hypothetical protein